MTQSIHKADPETQEISEQSTSSDNENAPQEVEDLAALSENTKTPEKTLEHLREEVLEKQILAEDQEKAEIDMAVVPDTPERKIHPMLQAVLCVFFGLVGIAVCIVMKVYGLAVLIAIFSAIIAFFMAKASRLGTAVSCIVMILAVIGYMMIGMSHLGKTRCCDGTWSDSTGRGACSHHGGVCPLSERTQCNDGTWSDSKGKGTCSGHGGIKK